MAAGMGRRCEEPYCLQIIPEHLFHSHQDRHVAERLAAEDFEQLQKSRNADEALARALALVSAEDESSNVNDKDNDYLLALALALNREFRIEEEEHSFRNVQKRELRVESQEERERPNKSIRLDETRSSPSNQLILGPNLTLARNQLRSNQTPGLIHGLQMALEASSSSAYSVLCHPGVSHFGFEFRTLGWGCGYNNAQVLLSYLREASPDIYRTAFGNEIPSIRTIQTLIQAGWAKGIDNEGADQLRQVILDTRKWIGTTEIYTLMTSSGFRCLVHDFEFQKPPYELSLIKYVEDYFNRSNPQNSGSSIPSCRISDRPPLYFQHSGHSRTIIGIERLKNKTVNLLLFDPQRRPSSVIRDYAEGKVNKKDLSDTILKPFRVSMDEIARRKEYQILRLQEGMIDPVEVEIRNKVHCIKMNS